MGTGLEGVVDIITLKDTCISEVEKETLGDKFCKELEDELRHDKAGTLAHQPAPYLAAFVTVLALFFQFMANYRISQVL